MLLGCCHCGQAIESVQSYSFSIASDVTAECLPAIGFTVVPKKYRITSSVTDGTCACTNFYHINGNGPDPYYVICDPGGWFTPPYTPPPTMTWSIGGFRPNLCGSLNVMHSAEVRWGRTGASAWYLEAYYGVSGGFTHYFYKTFSSLPDPLSSHTVPFNSFPIGDATHCGAPADCTISPI